jgi:hypothetical protein
MLHPRRDAICVMKRFSTELASLTGCKPGRIPAGQSRFVCKRKRKNHQW